MFDLVVIRHLGRHDATHDAIFLFDDRHVEAGSPGDSRDLEPDIAGADDDEAFALVETLAHAFDVSDGSQVVHARQVDAIHGQSTHMGAKGQYQRVVCERLPARGEQALRFTIDRLDLRLEMQLDAGLFIKSRGFHVQAIHRQLACQELLRQRRPLVRQERFIAHKDDLSIELVLAQARDDLPCSMSGARYDYSLAHLSCYLPTPVPAATGSAASP